MKKRWKITLSVVLVIVLGFVLYGCAGMAMVRWEETHTPRDPETGIAIGAETKYLGPEDATGAVLFVHGFVGGSSNFAGLPEAVAAEGWRVRLMRLPGHGTSPRDFAKTTVEELIAAVRDETAALQSEYPRVVLVGHSMGGTLSTLVASEKPVAGLALGGAYFGVTHRWWYGLRPETWARIGSPLLPYVYKGKLFVQVNKPEAKPHIFSYTWVPTNAMQTLMEAGRQVNDEDLLQRVQCPVLMLHAPGDVAASYEAAVDAFEKMGSTDKELITLERSNHHIFWDYEQEEVQQAVVAFVNKCLATP